MQCVLLYLLISALHTRNEFVLDGGDRYLRCMLFVSCFVPLGALYSLDCVVASGNTNHSSQLHHLNSVNIISDNDAIDNNNKNIRHATTVYRRGTYDYASWGTCLFLAQIFWLYFTSGLVKTGEEWTSGRALALVLRCEGFISRFALQIRDSLPPILTTCLTYLTIGIEAGGGWLLFLKPLSHSYSSFLLFFSFISHHRQPHTKHIKQTH